MKSTKKALTLLAVFLIAPITACAVKNALPINDGPINPIEPGNDIQDEYDLNEEFKVPEYEFEVDDGTFVKATSHSLTFPRGESFISDEFVLNQTGIYTLKYYLTYNGKNYLETKRFTVKPYVASFNSEETSLYYGVDPRAAQFKVPEDVPGLNISVANGDVVTLNETINVNELTMDKPLFKGYIVPSTEGISDMHYLYFKLTDVKDPSVFIKFRLIQYFYNDNDKRNPGMAYWSAGGNNQTCKGLDTNGTGTIHDEDWWGTFTGTSFTATTKGATDYTSIPCKPSSRYFQINYDNLNKAIYCVTGNNVFYLISELANPSFFNDLWGGFPSGKARLSLYTEDNQTSENPTICLTEVHGVNLTKEKYEDTDAPEISVDCSPYTKDTMPAAQRGLPYPVPEATAYDEFDGETKVNTKVFYNYGTSSQESVKIKDGYFTPTKVGYYAIVFESSDTMGNIGTEVVYVMCDPNIKPLKAVLEDVEVDSKIGAITYLPPVTITGGVGDPSVEVSASKGTSLVPVYNDGDGFYFTPDKTGKWLITYTVTDYIGTIVEVKLIVDVKENPDPVLDSVGLISDNLVKGLEYRVPEVIARKYNGDNYTTQVCDLVINDNTYKPGQKFSITEDSTLVFKCDDKIIYSKSVECFDAYDADGLLDFGAYFKGNINTSIDENGFGVIVSSTGDLNYEFRNPLFCDNFVYRIIPSEHSKNISNILVTLSDFYDEENKLEINIRVDQENKKIYVSAAGGIELPFDVDLSVEEPKESTNIEIKLDYGSLSVNAVTLDIGDEFEEFTSPYVKLSTEITSINPNSETSIKVRRISNQIFTKNPIDIIEPDSIVYGSFGGSFNINDIYYSAPILVNDVLSAVDSSTLKITNPNGEVVTDLDGKKLDNVDPSNGYWFKLDMIGDYAVTCNYSDSKTPYSAPASSGSLRYVIHCIDKAAPVITITSTPMTTAKVGEKVGLPSFTVTDNVTPADKLVIIRYFINPSGQFIMLEGDKTGVTTTAKGTYKWVIMAVDEYGNSSTKSGNIVVE